MFYSNFAQAMKQNSHSGKLSDGAEKARLQPYLHNIIGVNLSLLITDVNIFMGTLPLLDQLSECSSLNLTERVYFITLVDVVCCCSLNLSQTTNSW